MEAIPFVATWTVFLFCVVIITAAISAWRNREFWAAMMCAAFLPCGIALLCLWGSEIRI